MPLQIVLFSGPVSERIGDAGPPIYVASTALVLVAVLGNLRIPGMALVALGAACNLAAIVANGGYMPASQSRRGSRARRRRRLLEQRVIASPALEP